MRWIDHTPGPCPVPQGTLVDVHTLRRIGVWRVYLR